MNLRDTVLVFGYLRHVRALDPLSFALLANTELLTDFVHWHATERYQQITPYIYQFVADTQSLVHHYFKDPAAAQKLSELRAELGKPVPVRNKQSRMVSVAELLSAAISEFPSASQLQRLPRGEGRQVANHAARAVA